VQRASAWLPHRRPAEPVAGDARGTQRERLDLSAMAREIADALEQESPGRCVQWQSTGLERARRSALMRIALQNLLLNAWKFTGRTERR